MSADQNDHMHRHHRWTRWQLFGILAGIWVCALLLYLMLVR